MDYPTEANHYLAENVSLLLTSYRDLLGKDLIEPQKEPSMTAKALFDAPFPVLSHTHANDPLFNYANLKALELFGFTWEELMGMPSRLSAEPVCQQEREALLQKVAKDGFIDNYQGVRLTKTGARFLIQDTVVWNLYDQSANFRGQAAAIRRWSFLDA